MYTSAILLAGCAEATWAQPTALTVSGSPASFLVSTAVAGSQPAGLMNNFTTYFVKVKNSAGVQKISAQLDAPMPPGTTLTIQLGTPAGATNLGTVTLDAVARDVIVNIAKENGVTLGVTYGFTAAVAAGVLSTQTRKVTLTLSSYP